MTVFNGLAEKIRKDPFGISEQFAIAAIALAALLAFTSTSRHMLLFCLGLVVIASVAKNAALAREKRWSIDLETRGSTWDARHWKIWWLRLVSSVSIAAVLGAMFGGFASQFAK